MIQGLESFVYMGISIAISFGLVMLTRKIVHHKLSEPEGAQKLNGIVTIIIAVSEAGYLAINFGLIEFALEIITTIGVGMVFLGIAFQHQLKNIASGIGLFFSHEVNVGDIVKIKDEQGTIIEIHLTKTVALTDDGERIVIPNQKFAEEVIKIKHASREDPFKKK